jgi:hypothetical protein
LGTAAEMGGPNQAFFIVFSLKYGYWVIANNDVNFHINVDNEPRGSILGYLAGNQKTGS